MSRKPEETVTTTDLRRAEAGLRAGRVPKSKVGPERPLRELRSTKLIAGELHNSKRRRRCGRSGGRTAFGCSVTALESMPDSSI
jgi:hypothetical protein